MDKSSDWGRKPEYLEEIPEAQGEHVNFQLPALEVRDIFVNFKISY